MATRLQKADATGYLVVDYTLRLYLKPELKPNLDEVVSAIFDGAAAAADKTDGANYVLAVEEIGYSAGYPKDKALKARQERQAAREAAEAAQAVGT